MNWKESQFEISQLTPLLDSPNGWKTFAQKLFETSSLEVTFFCLSGITDFISKRYSTFSAEEKNQLKEALFTYMFQKSIPSPEDGLKIKTAITIIAIFQQEYPEQWPQFFDDIATALLTTNNGVLIQRDTINEINPSTLPSQDFIMMYLHILNILDQEAVSYGVVHPREDADRIMAIKDSMRDIAIEKLVDTWYSILVLYHERSVKVTKACLQVIKAYISWIDIRIVVNNLFLPIIVKLASNIEYMEGVVECLYEILLKGIQDPLAKLRLMQSLQVPAILQNITFDANESLQSSASRTVCIMGTELMRCMMKLSVQIEQDVTLQKEVDQLLGDSLQLLFTYLNSEYDESGQNLLQFALTYLNYLRKLKESNQFNVTHAEHLNIFLHILLKKCKYPDDYNFENKELNDDYQTFRKDFNKLFLSITTLGPELVANFLGNLIANIGQIQNPTEIEVVIHFLYLMGEGVQEKIQENAAFFSNAVISIARSPIMSAAQPPYVHISFFEVVNRYAKQINDHDSLMTLLPLWLGNIGIMYELGEASSKICYLFNRFVKTMKESLQPFLDDIVEYLKGALIFTPESYAQMDRNNQLEILEAVSQLIGGNKRDTSKHRRYFDILAMPLIENIKGIMLKELYRTNEESIIWIKDLITAVGTFAKGFPLQIQQNARLVVYPEAVEFYIGAIEVIYNVLNILYENDLIKESVIFFFKKTSVCVPLENYVQMIPMINQKLKSPLTVNNLINCIKLFIHFITVSDSSIFECLNQEFMPLVAEIIDTILKEESIITPKSEEERELTELKHMYYTFLQTVVLTKATNVLATPKNISGLNNILQTLLQGCVTYNDLNIQKLSFSILRSLVVQWAVDDESGGSLPGFVEFIYQSIVPKLFEVPLNKQFSMEEGKTIPVFGEIASLEHTIAQCRSKEFESYLKDIYFPHTLKVDFDQTLLYLSVLFQTDMKIFKKSKRNFIRSQKEA